MANAPERRWRAGDVVVLRYVETPASARMRHAIMGDSVGLNTSNSYPFLVNSEVITVGARPYRVVMDTNEAVVLHQPEGTPTPRWHIKEERYLDNVQRTRGETLRFLFPDRAYDVTLFFEGDGEAPWFYDALFDGEGLVPGWRERRRTAPDPIVAASKRDRRFRGWYVNLQSPFRRTSYGFDIVDHTLDVVVRPDRTWYWKDEDELDLAVAKGALAPEEAQALRRTGEQALELLAAREGPFDETWTLWRSDSNQPLESFPDGWQSQPALVAEETEGGG